MAHKVADSYFQSVCLWVYKNESKKEPMKTPHTMKKKCKNFNHDFKNLKRYGRADWRCPRCGENVILLLVLAQQTGIDLTQ